MFFNGSSSNKWMKDLIDFEDSFEAFDFFSELNKFITQCFAIVNFVLSLLVEVIIATKM